MKWFLLVAIVFGVGAFLLDAFFAHGLRAYLGDHYSDAAQHALSTAARYQLIASVMMLILIVLYRIIPNICVPLSAFFTTMGVIFFCLTIYLKHLFGMVELARLAPLGGVSFMLAFMALIPLFLAL